MRTAIFITSILGGLSLASCSRPKTIAPSAEEKSVEQRVAELEQQLNANTSQSNKTDGWKQYEHDLVEIQSLGLIVRAQQDFGRRLTNVTVESWRIGYFKHTNTVWCDVWYRLPGASETLQQGFGYSRKADTNWSLIWGVEGKPQ